MQLFLHQVVLANGSDVLKTVGNCKSVIAPLYGHAATGTQSLQSGMCTFLSVTEDMSQSLIVKHHSTLAALGELWRTASPV